MSNLTILLCHYLAQLTLFSLILSLGIMLRLQQLLCLWQKPGLLNRSILAIVVVVPMVAVLVVFPLQLPQEIKIGLILSAIAPGTSFCVPKYKQARSYAVALQATVSLLAIFTVPLTIALLQEFFPPEAQISPLRVGQQLIMAQFLPLLIGVTVRYCWSDFADNVERLIRRIANGLLCILLALVLVSQLKPVLHIGLFALTVIVLLTLLSLGIGHFLGGKESSTQMTLATTSATHSVALALFIAALNLPDLSVSPAIAVYGLISGALTIIYLSRNVTVQVH